jgi:O-antigen ligase
MLLAAAAGALVYGIYLTRSRGGALALVMVLWRFAAGRVGRVPALVLLVALGAGALALDFGGRSLSVQPDESASERLVAWTEGLEMLKAQPILGVGYGQFLDHHTLTAHNSLVLCFAETGLLGCFFWVGLFVVTLLELRGLKSLSGDEPFDDLARQWAEGLQLSLIGFMVAAFFLSRTFVPTLYLIIGLSAALAAVARGANRSVTLPALPELVTLVLGCELGGIAVVYTIVKLHLA